VLASLARVELSLGALPWVRCLALDRLIGLSEALGVMAPDRFGNVMHESRASSETARGRDASGTAS
jgi:hypothetical protein